MRKYSSVAQTCFCQSKKKNTNKEQVEKERVRKQSRVKKWKQVSERRVKEKGEGWTKE